MSDQNTIIEKCQCTICMITFNEKDHTPLLMKECGHTFCKKCISNSLSQNNLSLKIQCFLCRTENHIIRNDAEISQFPINYTVLSFVQANVSLIQDSKIPEEPLQCPKHQLPLDYICLNQKNCKKNTPICCKCMHESHKECNAKYLASHIKEILNPLQLFF